MIIDIISHPMFLKCDVMGFKTVCGPCKDLSRYDIVLTSIHLSMLELRRCQGFPMEMDSFCVLRIGMSSQCFKLGMVTSLQFIFHTMLHSKIETNFTS